MTDEPNPFHAPGGFKNAPVDLAKVRRAARKVGDRLEAERLERIARRDGTAPPAPPSGDAAPPPPPQYHPRYMVPCRHWIGDTETGGHCGATPTKQFKDGPRCRDHSPAALAGRPETKPDPARTIDGLRAAKGLPLAPIPTATATQVLEDRHAASGKRRASPHAVNEARARLRERARK